jgi:hypothetical protein
MAVIAALVVSLVMSVVMLAFRALATFRALAIGHLAIHPLIATRAAATTSPASPA